MKTNSRFFIPFIGLLLLILAILACSLPSQTQVQGGIATAQAAGQQVSQFATESAPTLEALKTQGANMATNAAPTLQAAKESAIEFATNAAPTLVALQTQAVVFATEAAPTVEAGIELAATAMVDTQERAAQAQATLQAAGINGQYLWQKVQQLRPDEAGNILISFTETELNLAMNAHLLVKKQEGEAPPLENMKISLQDGLIVVEGQLENPVSAQVRLLVQPFVQDGELALNIVAADANGYALPQFALNQIELMLDRTVVQAVNGVPFPANLENIYVGSQTITFAAVRT